MIPRRNRIFSGKLLNDMLSYVSSFTKKKKDYFALFEDNISTFLGVKYVSLVSSGRKGLELILKYFNFPKRSQIIIPGYTLKDLPIIVKNMGYNPVFVDIDINTCNMDPSQLEDKINEKTVLIIATHLFGLPSDMDKILNIANKYNLKVIEDCAHSLGASYKGKKVGSFSDAAFFSLALTKPINTFGGGIVTTDNKEIYEFIKKETSEYPYQRMRIIIKVITSIMEDLVINSPLYSLLVFLFYFDFSKRIFAKFYRGVRSSIRGTNTKYSNFQAYLGCKALLDIDKRNKMFKDKLDKFRRLLLKEISYPWADYPHTLAFYFNIVRTNHNNLKVRKEILKLGIDAGIKDEVSNNCPAYFGLENNFPNVDTIYNTLIQVPLSWDVSDAIISKIAQKLNSVIKDIS